MGAGVIWPNLPYPNLTYPALPYPTLTYLTPPYPQRIHTRSDIPTKQPTDIAFSAHGVAALSVDHDLCILGEALEAITQHSAEGNGQGWEHTGVKVCPHIHIFARTSPAQKEQVLLALNAAGLTTLMCGDGTNDVGALKAAHVG